MSTQKKRVLLIACNNLRRGGVQSVIMSIVRNMFEHFVFDIVLFTQRKSYYEDEFLSYGGEIFHCQGYVGDNRLLKKADIYTRPKRLTSFAKGLFAKKKNYAAIHCHNAFEAGPFLKAAAEAGIPSRIVHTHVITYDCKPIMRRLRENYMKMIKQYATAMIGCSKEVCDSMYGDAALVVSNAFDSKRFNPALYSEPALRPIHLLQVGNFSDLKNQLFTLQIVDTIRMHYPNVKCSLVGFDVGGYQRKIVREIDRLRLEANITFYPHDADTPRLLSEATAFLVPSRSEGFGIVLIEAQAMGVSCYASDCVPITTNCGGCTYLPLTAGAESWADKIIQDYEQSHGRHQNYDVSTFSEEVVMREYTKLYGGVK